MFSIRAHDPSQWGVTLVVMTEDPEDLISLRIEAGSVWIVDHDGNEVFREDFPREARPFVNWNRIGRRGQAGGLPVQVGSPNTELAAAMLADVRTWTATVHRRFKTTTLYPGRSYQAFVEIAGRRDNCSFRTLPSSLDDPLIIGLASCYWAYRDEGRLINKAWNRATRDTGIPHVKFLAGDQVYIDQPPQSEFELRKSMEELWSYLTGRYELHWGRMSELLRNGASMFLPDDHEFWNNYPYLPGWPWRALQSYPRYRSDLENCCNDLFDAYQGAQPFTTRKIGDDLEIAVLDTRRYRDWAGTQFTPDWAMAQLEGWVHKLKSPGVLVLSQPLFQPAYGDKPIQLPGAGGGKRENYERNIGAHEPKYETFCRILTSSPADIVVLSGEIHISRVGLAEFTRNDGSTLRVYEVISSPLRRLNTNPLEADPDSRSDRVKKWPPSPWHCSGVQGPVQVQYPTAHVAEGFALLNVTRADPDVDGRPRVRMRIGYHGIDPLQHEIARAKSTEIVLTGAHPRSGTLSFVRPGTKQIEEFRHLIPMGVGAIQTFTLELHNFSNTPARIENVATIGDPGCALKLPTGGVELQPNSSMQVPGTWEAMPSIGHPRVDPAPYDAQAVIRVQQRGDALGVDSSFGSQEEARITLRVSVILPPFPDGVSIGAGPLHLGTAVIGRDPAHGHIWITNGSSDDIVLRDVKKTGEGIRAGSAGRLPRLARSLPFGSLMRRVAGRPEMFRVDYPAGEVIPTEKSLSLRVTFTPTKEGGLAYADLRIRVHKRDQPTATTDATVHVTASAVAPSLPTSPLGSPLAGPGLGPDR
jgi:hypothetical protein